MNPTAEGQLKKYNLPVTRGNVRQYTWGYAMILPSILMTIWWLPPLKRLAGQVAPPFLAHLVFLPMIFVLPAVLWLLFSRKSPAFVRGLRDVMVLMVTIIPIGLMAYGLKMLILMAGKH